MSTTTDLSKFGIREIAMVRDLLAAWIDVGLPNDFEHNEVVPMMNMSSGNVFLTNTSFQVAMMNDGKLESFYSSPYEGLEGFYDELLEQYDDMDDEDKEWFDSVREGRI